jgi:hypothetical protein
VDADGKAGGLNRGEGEGTLPERCEVRDEARCIDEPVDEVVGIGADMPGNVGRARCEEGSCGDDWMLGEGKGETEDDPLRWRRFMLANSRCAASRSRQSECECAEGWTGAGPEWSLFGDVSARESAVCVEPESSRPRNRP